ncbi:MAG: SMP-30/gluconolactonase/LRE family protein [Chloroflexi bacterium]|nr:SMP-30/gluconolactonase/LRE family protein [Chloroflexota bacterium]
MDFTTGLGKPEAPVLLPDGSWLCVEMAADRGCVTHISADGKTRCVVAKTGRPNGLALDKNGVVWVAESSTSALLRLSLNGRVEKFLSECNGEPFLFPNDLCFGPDGNLYMTDSGILPDQFAPGGKLRPDYASVKPDGRVYQISVQAKRVKKLDSGILFTNGIAFGPDKNLYVNETLTGMIYRYSWRDGVIVGPRERFGNVIDPAEPDFFKGPDGMKFAANGYLYVSVFGQGNVTVLDPNGAVAERVQTRGRKPTNLAFGTPGSRRIYVTEAEYGAIEVLNVDADGLPL